MLINGSTSESIPDSILSEMAKLPGYYLDVKFPTSGNKFSWVHSHEALLVDFLLKKEVGSNFTSYYAALVQSLCCPDRQVRT